MKRIFAAVVTVGAGVALSGGVAAVQAAKNAMTREERAQLRLQRQQRHGKRIAKAIQEPRQARSADGALPSWQNLVGTITYDPGAPADAFLSEPAGNNIITNRFNSALGAPLRPGNLTGVTFFPGIVMGSFAVVSVLGPPAAVGNAAILDVFYVTGFASNTFNTVALPPVAVGGDFMAGQYVGSFDGPDEIGVRSASVDGQGFHAHQMNFINSYLATGVVALPGQNAMFRATGNLLTPLELIDFNTP
jgi:hypothetical protein